MAEEQAGPIERAAVTGRPQDEPAANTTFRDRASARKPKAKAVQDAENKAVSADKPTRKTNRK